MTQIIASIFASLMASILLPNILKEREDLIPYPKSNVDALGYQIFIFEMILSFLYVFIYYATVLDAKAPNNVFGFALGSIIGVSILGGLGISGGCTNPVRIIGPSLLSGEVNVAIQYTAATVSGGVLGGFYHQFFILKEKKK